MQTSPISACAAAGLDMSGFVFVVGKPGNTVFPENEGIVLGAGQVASVGLTDQNCKFKQVQPM